MERKTVFWDYLAGVYDVFVNIINAKTHKALRAEVIPLFNPSDVVLECACGTGMLTEAIAPWCREVVATDFSKNMVRKAEAKCKNQNNVRFVIADILNLCFADSAFDKVVAGNVIHLLDSPYQALRELERVCKTNGKIIIPTYINRRTNNKESELAKVIGKIGVDFKQKFTFASYRQFFTDSGYRGVQYIDVDGFIPCSIAIIEKRKQRGNHEGRN